MGIISIKLCQAVVGMWVFGLAYVVWVSADIIGLVHIGGWILLSRSELVGGLSAVSPYR